MMASAVLSAVLANDIVCFAFTPVLALAVIRAGLNPLPFLLGLAVSSNIGSAATIIGNPQNMLIGQVGRLHFAHFFFWCGPPAIISLFGSYLIILSIYRKEIARQVPSSGFEISEPPAVFNRWQTGKGLVFTGILITFKEHAAVGVPVTLFSLAVLVAWVVV